MTFQSANQTSPRSDPGISDKRDLASLQTKPNPEIKLNRDKRMDWKPDLVLDATEWIQRAALHDEPSMQEVVLFVAPALLAEVVKLRSQLETMSGSAAADQDEVKRLRRELAKHENP